MTESNIKNYLIKNRTIFIILFFALILRLAYFGIILKNFGEAGFYLTKNGDAVEYFYLAKNTLESGVFSSSTASPLVPEIFRTPGYPAFIILLYKIIPSVAWVIFWQNILFVGFIFVIWHFFKNYFNRQAVIVAAAFLSFEPAIIYRNNQFLSESLFSMMVFGAFAFSFLAVRQRNYFAAVSGLFIAAALYVRPIGHYLLFVFGIFYLLAALTRKIQWKKFILIFLLSALTFYMAIFPWMLRNKRVFGSFAISTSSSATFSSYARAIAKNLKEKPAWVDSAGFFSIDDARSLRKSIIKYIASHPFIFAKVYALSLIMFFFGDSYLAVFDRIWPNLESQRMWSTWPWTFPEIFKLLRGHNGAEAIIFWFGKIIRSAIVSLFLFGIFKGLKDRKDRFALVGMLLLIFYFTLAAGVVSYSRFRFAVEPYIYLFVGLAVSHIFSGKKASEPKKILIITQAVDRNDPILGFFHRWLEEMSKRFATLKVVALRTGAFNLPSNASVYSLSGERGASRLRKIINFYYLIFRLRKKYDAVFVHMNPEYVVLAGPLWRLWRKPVYLWYVHKSIPWQLQCAQRWVKKIFTASAESCRLKNRKNVMVLGHGIDTELFSPALKTEEGVFKILSVGRMSPIKKFEIIIDALSTLIAKYNFLDFEFLLISPVINAAGESYKERLQTIISRSALLKDKIKILSGVPYHELPHYYQSADLFVHASETGSIDKVVLEAASCGTSVLTSGEAFIFLPEQYKFNNNDINGLAQKIIDFAKHKEKSLFLRNIVLENHSLAKLMDKIKQNIYRPLAK